MTDQTNTATKRPDDLASPRLTPDGCFNWDNECQFGIQCASVHRATATRNFADEMGVAFRDVTCRVRYMRLLTRQESYDARARDDYETHWIDNHQPPLHRDRVSGWKWVTPDGTHVTPPASLAVVPDDWEPDEDDPVWEFCDKTHPDAMRCWHLDIRPSRTSKPKPDPWEAKPADGQTDDAGTG